MKKGSVFYFVMALAGLGGALMVFLDLLRGSDSYEPWVLWMFLVWGGVFLYHYIRERRKN